MLDPKTPREAYPIGFDFSANMDSISTASVSAFLVSGEDEDPSAMLHGDPQISGSMVYQHIKGGVDGAKYCLLCQASNGVKTFELAASIEAREVVP